MTYYIKSETGKCAGRYGMTDDLSLVDASWAYPFHADELELAERIAADLTDSSGERCAVVAG